MPSYVWQRDDITGLDHAVWIEGGEGIAVAASEIAVEEGRHWSVRFSVLLDGVWRTRDLEVVVIVDDEHRRLSLAGDGEGHWTAGGEAAPGLDGCIDADVSATPMTNTFVIRRLGLAIGGTAELRVAWVGVPDLEVVALRQTYTRLEPEEGLDRYEYEDERFGRWLLTVDPDGVVVDYRGFAHRIG